MSGITIVNCSVDFCTSLLAEFITLREARSVGFDNVTSPSNSVAKEDNSSSVFTGLCLEFSNDGSSMSPCKMAIALYLAFLL